MRWEVPPAGEGLAGTHSPAGTTPLLGSRFPRAWQAEASLRAQHGHVSDRAQSPRVSRPRVLRAYGPSGSQSPGDVRKRPKSVPLDSRASSGEHVGPVVPGRARRAMSGRWRWAGGAEPPTGVPQHRQRRGSQPGTTWATDPRVSRLSPVTSWDHGVVTKHSRVTLHVSPRMSPPHLPPPRLRMEKRSCLREPSACVLTGGRVIFLSWQIASFARGLWEGGPGGGQAPSGWGRGALSGGRFGVSAPFVS